MEDHVQKPEEAFKDTSPFGHLEGKLLFQSMECMTPKSRPLTGEIIGIASLSLIT